MFKCANVYLREHAFYNNNNKLEKKIFYEHFSKEFKIFFCTL